MQTYITNSFEETQRLGEDFAKKILKKGLSRRLCRRGSSTMSGQKSAVVLGLQGNLGGGKTTFMQGFAKGLGINEKILSPTYVILKHFKIQNSKFTDFYHVDCYRINKPEEILELDWEEIISNPKNIVAVEWPEKIKKFLSKQTMFLDFKFVNETQREMKIDTISSQSIIKL